MRLIVASILTTGFLLNSAAAAVNLSHVGATDPLTEGFIADGAGFSVTTGPIINDLGSGKDAWIVDDNSTVGGSVLIYRGEIYDAPTMASILSSGWRLSTEVRIVSGTAGAFYGTGISFRTGSRAFIMGFDVDSDGDPFIDLLDGNTYTLEGVGNTGYHTYEFVYDPISATADFYVDGVERISNYAGVADTFDARVAWGGFASNGTGQANFHSVSFTEVPEPSSYGYVMGLAVLLCLAKRRSPHSIQS